MNALSLLLIACCVLCAYSLQPTKLANAAKFNKRSVIVAHSTPAPWTGDNDGKKSVREMAKFKNKVPFDEDTYKVLKASIELLSKRIEEGELLTKDEAKWMVNAVEHIIEDAHKYGPPAKPIPVDTEDL